MNKTKITFFAMLLCFAFYGQAQDVSVGDENALNVAKAEELYNNGIQQFNAKDLKGAIATFDSVLVLVPSFEKALFNRGSVKYQLKDYAGAIVDFNTVIQLNPDSNNAHFLLGRSHYERNEKDLAMSNFTKAIAINPAHAEAYYYRGGMFFMEEKYDGK